MRVAFGCRPIPASLRSCHNQRERANAMRDKIVGMIEICVDCMLVHANGECDPDRPTNLPEPLSQITAGFSITMGLSAEDHSEYCTPADRDEGCDCELIQFSRSRCEGCGDWHHGERYRVTLWQERREVTRRIAHSTLYQAWSDRYVGNPGWRRRHAVSLNRVAMLRRQISTYVV